MEEMILTVLMVHWMIPRSCQITVLKVGRKIELQMNPISNLNNIGSQLSGWLVVYKWPTF